MQFSNAAAVTAMVLVTGVAIATTTAQIQTPPAGPNPNPQIPPPQIPAPQGSVDLSSTPGQHPLGSLAPGRSTTQGMPPAGMANQAVPPVNHPPANATMPMGGYPMMSRPAMAGMPTMVPTGSTGPGLVAVQSDSMLMTTRILPSGSQQITLIFLDRMAMCVYSVDMNTGEIALQSVRQLGSDVQLESFNGIDPSPAKIRAMLTR